MDDADPRGGTPDRDDTPLRRRDLHRPTATHPRRRRVLLAVLAFAVVLGLVAGVAFWRLSGNINRVDVSGALGTDRPTRAPQAAEAVNLLLVGSDTREGEGNDEYGMPEADPGQHSDTNLLVHLSADREWAMVVSIPRDSMVPAPPDCSPTAPQEEWTVKQWNWNYRDGGTGCLIRTLEGNTGVFVDHFAVVDFRGFQDMVDALGGVEVCTTQPITDQDSGLQLAAGTHVLEGEQALAYVRTRKSLGDGSDLGRIERQQAFLSSVAQEATSSELLFQPTRLYGFLDAATRSLTTDPEFGLGTMRDLAESVRGIGLDNVEFLTVPNEPYPADTNRVQWQESADVIWEAIREDRRIGEEPDPAASPTPSEEPLTVSPDEVTVEVLNGTGAPGLAGQTGDFLAAQGFTVASTGNAVDAADGTLVEHSVGQEEAARTAAAAFPGATLEEADGLGENVRVTLGPGSATPVEVPNRVGDEPLPTPTAVAPSPGPSASPTIEARAADEDICS